jgi:C4-dicarboxylate-specific signal transduction histidine kinase
LASKNTQLEDEIRRRCEVEKKLEEQRTLRIRSDRLRSLGEMAAGIAHELNQPLVGVRGLAELVLLTMDSEQMDSQHNMRKNVSLIVEQADRMVHIINHVRLFARDAGNLEMSLTDLNDVVKSGISLLKAQFRSHGLLFESEFSKGSLPVRVNPFSVEEVIVNLLANARDAVEKRKREEGYSYAPRVQISTGHEKKNGKDTVYLRVKDNGKGIPQSIADKVFDPFFTTKDPDRGTGLGLSICKSIVEEFGGSIQFRSTDAEGTIFTISFPAHSNGETDTDGYTEVPKDTRSG